MSDLVRELNSQLVATWPSGQLLTSASLSAALEERQLQPVRGWQWVVEASRGALFVACRSHEESLAQKGKAATAKQLERHAQKTWELWQALFVLDDEADGAVFWQSVEESGGPLPNPSGDTPSFRRFREAVDELQFVAGLLERAAKQARRQIDRPRWTERRWKETRISAAICLSWVFEQGFGRAATVNSWEGPDGQIDRGPWAAFYCAAMTLVFPGEALPDLEGVLDAARRGYLAHGVTFAPGIMPE